MINAFAISAAIATKYEAQIGAVMQAKERGGKLPKGNQAPQTWRTQQGDRIRAQILSILSDGKKRTLSQLYAEIKDVGYDAIRGHLSILRRDGHIKHSRRVKGRAGYWMIA